MIKVEPSERISLNELNNIIKYFININGLNLILKKNIIFNKLNKNYQEIIPPHENKRPASAFQQSVQINKLSNYLLPYKNRNDMLNKEINTSKNKINVMIKLQNLKEGKCLIDPRTRINSAKFVNNYRKSNMPIPGSQAPTLFKRNTVLNNNITKTREQYFNKKKVNTNELILRRYRFIK